MLGVSWGDVGDASKWGFQNVVHPFGKGVATAFGAGSAAQSLENVEVKQGWLPATATATAAAIETAASKTKDPKKDAVKTPMVFSTDIKPAGRVPTTVATTVKIVGAVGVVGIVALILRRLWRG